MSTGEFRRVDERLVHRGNVWNVVVAEFEAPDGERFHRDVVRSPGVVAVVPLRVDEHGTTRVVLVEQFRPTMERTFVKIPAGMRDIPGEPLEECARRELLEETGYRAGSLEPLSSHVSSAGMSDSIVHTFVATDLEADQRDVHGPEERHMLVLEPTFAEALAMVDRGEIDDAKTVVALLMLDRRLRAG